MVLTMVAMEAVIFVKLFAVEKNTIRRLSKFEFIYETANAFPASLELTYAAPSRKLSVNKRLPYTLTFPKWHQDLVRVFRSWFRLRFQVITQNHTFCCYRACDVKIHI